MYRSSASGGPYSLLAVGVSEGLFSDVGLTRGATYYYVVRAVNGSGESADSVEVCAVAYVQGYQDRDGIVSMEAENGTLGDRWVTGSDATASGGAYIEVDPAYDWTGFAPENTLDESVVKYNFTITSGDNYRFWFRMHTDGGAGSDDSFFWRIDNGSWNLENSRSGIGSWFSADNAQVDNLTSGDHVLEIAYRENGTRLDKFIVQLDRLIAPSGVGSDESIPPPFAPSGLTATAESAEQIDLSWNTSAGAQSYEVGRSITRGGPYAVIASNIVYSSYSDQIDLVAGTRYYYVVNAVNDNGVSDASNEADAVPSAAIDLVEYTIANFAVEGGTNLNLTVSNSVPGLLYSIWATENLLVPDWQRVSDEQDGTGQNLYFNILIEGEESNRFFKLDVLCQ